MKQNAENFWLNNYIVTPTTAKALLDAGYKVHIERSVQRIFEDKEFEKYGPPVLLLRAYWANWVCLKCWVHSC